MISRLRTSLERADEGFTLIELLVVMIIIGILAAIAIPTFLNQRKNGYNATTKTDLSNFGLAVESASVDKGGDFTQVITTTTAPSQLANSGVIMAGMVAGFEFRGSDQVDIVLATVPTKTDYCLVGANTNFGAPGAQTDGWWTYSKSKGGLQPTMTTSEVAAIALC